MTEVFGSRILLSSFLDKDMCAMNSKVCAGTGAGFIGIGTAFLALGISGQSAFTGVGLIFFGLGIGGLARASKRSTGA
ncbi:MAG: hypothetical protein J0I01_06340 [Stenotrophomonas nitritireducens]|uniref:hypothetical protein n=1 Tax=Stenotrophomonas nitritireducens TaxID=83617 RepID=UPI001AD030FA|nr:hypothetical protein [Stenotrophomonas nitritireducens]MBN8791831.1 hypothetical protein [Stenotrophomonas nitritireducens]